MKANATAAAMILLGLNVSATPLLGVPILPLELMSIGQTDSPEVDLRRKSEELVKRARAAMKGGNLELAERWVAEAEKLKVPTDGLLSRFTDTPQKVRKDLDKMKTGSGKPGLAGLLTGKKPDPLKQTPPQRLPNEAVQGARQLPPTGAANPFASPLPNQAAGDAQVRTKQALGFVAQAAAALGRGDLATAERMARQAEALRLPERAYGGGTTPWELLLKVDKQRRQQGSGAVAGAGLNGQVAPAVFDPTKDNSYVRTASAEEALPPTDALAQQVRGLQPLTQQPPPVQYPAPGTSTIGSPFNGTVPPTVPSGQFTSPGTESIVVETPSTAGTTTEFPEVTVISEPDPFGAVPSGTIVSPESSGFPSNGVNTTVSGVAPVEIDQAR